MRNTVNWWRPIYPYLYDVACQASWRRLSSEARGPKARPFVQYPKSLHLAHKKPEYGYGFIPYLVIKKIASKSTVYIVDWRLLSPSLCNVWGFLSGPRVLLHCSNERLEYYAAHGKPLWRHIMGSVTSSMHSHDKTNERTLSYRFTDNAIERCQSNYRK